MKSVNGAGNNLNRMKTHFHEDIEAAIEEAERVLCMAMVKGYRKNADKARKELKRLQAHSWKTQNQ